MHRRNSPIVRPLPALLVAGIFLAMACGGGDGGTGPSPNGLATVAVTPTTSTLYSIAPGNTVSLTVVGKDKSGAVLAGTPTFSSGNAAAATVDAAGLVTATGAGASVITATLAVAGVTKTGTMTVSVQAAPAAATVLAPAIVFSPGTVDVKAGGAVTWTIAAIHHTVHFSGAGAPADIDTLTNASATRSFSTNGTYAYQCTIHPSMTGTVRVH
jgi:plastocyanin